jgi:DivIVA domain-containing protein
MPTEGDDMRAQDVAEKRFQPTKYRNGYDQQDVDDLLDRVQATLIVAEGGTIPTTGRLATAKPLRPEDVKGARFRVSRWREGYDQDQVDDFLDDVVAELRRLGKR